MIKVIIFDFDGTVADTYPIIFYAFKTIFMEFNKENVNDQTIVNMFGPPESRIIRNYFPGCKEIGKIIERYYQLYDARHEKLVKPVFEINDMLKSLKSHGLKLALVTGKGRRSLDISLTHLFPEKPFDITVAGDEVKNPKPHPEGLFKVLSSVNCIPSQSVFVGDSSFDFKAGSAAGMKTIGVNWFDKNGKFGWKDEKPNMVFKLPRDLSYYFTSF